MRIQRRLKEPAAHKRRPWRTALMVALLMLGCGVCAAGPPARITVRQADASLRASPTEHSRRLGRLAVGQVLIPLAGVDGSQQRWYFVETDAGVQGWVLATEVDGGNHLERTLRESASLPGGTNPTSIFSPAASPYGNRAAQVSVQMNGGAIFVPVRLNRSHETRMMMDTGATLTMVTPGLARILGLKPQLTITLVTANGPVLAPVAKLSSLRVGSAEVRDISVAIHDFGPAAGVGGLLGINFLRQFHTSLDSEKQLLTLKPNQ